MRHRPVLILVFIALLVSPALRAQDDIPEVARTLMEEAERASAANRLDEAIAKYTRVIEVAPALASAYVNLGAIYFKQGKIDQAYKTFARGVDRAPANRTLLSNAAAAAQQLGKSAEALTLVDRALETNRRDSALFALRSTILRALQRNDDALAASQQAVQLSPDDAKLQFSLGNLFYQLGKREDAVVAYRKAVDLDRNYLRAWYNLGAVLFESGKDDEALQAYRVALAPIEKSFAKKEKVDPIHARAYANLGAIYLRQKQYPQATDAYQKALRLEPEDAAAQYNLAFIDYSTGKLDRAEEGYRKALARDASLPLAYLHLADIALRGGDAAKAIQTLNQGMPKFDAETRFTALHTLGKAHIARGDRAAARATFEEIARQAPDDIASLVHLTYERFLTARETGDLAGERVALETLMARGATDAMRAAHALLLVRQGDFNAARSELALTSDRSLATIRSILTGQSAARDSSPLVAAVLDALSGRLEPAARALASMGTAIARGNAGLLFWQLGRETDARTHLTTARAAIPDWTEVTIALGQLALASRRYDDAIEILSAVKCDSAQAPSVTGQSLQMTLGKSDDLCSRQRRALAAALLSQAAEEAASSPRRSRQFAERAASLDPRLEPLSLFLRGTADAATGEMQSARDALSRAIAAGLPQAIESAARRNLEAAQVRESPAQPAEPTSAQQRRTVVVFLPDAPAENDRKLADGVNALLANAESTVPLDVEFFRRAADARAFIAANRDRIGIVISNPEFISGEFSPRFQMTRDGRQTYRRVVVVPANSPIRNANDLRSRTVSGVDVLGDIATTGTAVAVTDDLTAIANVLYGKSDAALVSEDNPLLAQRESELRVVYTSAPQRLPVLAFAPMPRSDRDALDAALRGARSALGSLSMIEREVKPEPRREISYVSATALGLRPLEPPASVGLRVTVDLPRIEVPEPPLP